MISIIILHRNPFYLEQIKQNIAETIGVEYELVVIDNRDNQYNIFQGYNIGVKQSKNSILCFSHEDILFHTKNWGKNLLNHFRSDETIGLIGTVGGNAAPNCPAPWWNNSLINDQLVNNINTWQEQESYHEYKNPYNKNKVEAVLLDGFWFSTKREIFQKIAFDEKTFDGFHCYDSDICLQIIQQKYKVYVVYDILIEHFSPGSINHSWIESVEKLADKWHNHLPIFAKEVNENFIPAYHYKCLLTYVYWMQSLNYDDKKIREIIEKYYKRIIFQAKTREWLLLYLWKSFGYSLARYPFKILKFFYNKF